MNAKPLFSTVFTWLTFVSLLSAQNTYVPDDNFEQALIYFGYDSGALNDSVSTVAIDTIKGINLSYWNIKSLEGIQDFKDLEFLFCNNNEIDTLDLSNNKRLKELFCYDNQAKCISLNNNQELEILKCYNNRISTINLSSCLNLRVLKIQMNNLEKLDVSKNLFLQQLECHNNQISSLDVTANLLLENLSCGSNKLIELDVSLNSSLVGLGCAYNKLSTLNIKNGNNENMRVSAHYNPNLLCIQVDNEPLAYSNQNFIKNGFAIFSEDCSNYDVSMFYVPDDNFEQALIDLNYDYGELNDSVPIHAINKLKSLYIQNKNISDLTGIERFTTLEILQISGNNLNQVDLNSNLALKKLYCSRNRINNLDLSNLLNLEILHCDQNNLTNLDISNNIAIKELACSDNQIVDMKLSQQKNENLTFINCSENQITKLNVSVYPKLINLYCLENKLKDLDLSQNTSLTILDCHSNQLINLNLQNGNNDEITYLKTTNNPELSCIQVDNANEASHYIKWYKDEYVDYSKNCGSQGSDIPINEYNALIKLYNSTVGPGWTNNTNWLDTINYSVADWYGITVENNHVTEIKLANNNLQESVFEDRLNLPYLRVLDISGNMIDDANFYSLDSLKYLEKVNIENNNFVFKHILPLLKSTYFDNYKDNFSYSPQAKVGTLQELTLEKGGLIEIEVPSIYLSENDQLQWYKDGVAIPGENQSWYDKSGITQDDTGIYTLQITNSEVSLLTLLSQNINVNVTDEVAGVPRLEYEALVDLYNHLDGSNWFKNYNWLDTVNSNVNDWYGIQVENGHITQIQLIENNLIGTLPSSLANIKKLAILNLERNSIGGVVPGTIRKSRAIPDNLGTLNNLIQLSLAYNSIQFNDLESILSWPNYSNLSSFSYNYQNSLHKYINRLVGKGERVLISLQNYFPAPSDQYQWVKNNDPIPGANDSVLVIEDTDISDEATYYCVLTNTKLPNLNITNYSTTLEVNAVHGAGIPIIEFRALKKLYKTCNGANWRVNTNWLDTTSCSVKDWAGVEVRNGHVSYLHLDSNKVVGELPDEIYDLIYLKGLGMVQNQLSGSFTKRIEQLKQLEVFSISNNMFSGTIPEEIGSLKNLWYLGFSNNNFTGLLPTTLSQCNNLIAIFFSNNTFDGEIPESYGSFSKLRFLDISKNAISGKIPASLGNLMELNVLNLSHNSLIGPVPVEFENLSKAYRIDITNNSFGTNDANKSVLINNTDFNRQIPDELGTIMDIDTLLLGKNSLQFNDIEAIFNWDNFDDINEFIYSPQNRIGIEKIVNTEVNSSVTLSLDNYYPGPSDIYQWYKDNSKLISQTTSTLLIDKVVEEDAGTYYCEVSNAVAKELILTSNTITLIVNNEDISTEIPHYEYEALGAIYNQMGGGSWGHSWLDTVSSTVDDWEGITVRNGHVVKLDLSNLNIESKVFDIFSAFDSLEWVNLSNNKLFGPFPSFFQNDSNATKSVKNKGHVLSYLNISNNNFMFVDLESVAEELFSIDTFIYYPQQYIGIPVDTTIYRDSKIDIEIEDYMKGDNDEHIWFKNNTLTAIKNPVYSIENANIQDNGIYRLEISNDMFPNLILQSQPYKLSVSTPVGIDNKTTTSFNFYPNPAVDKLYIDTQNKKVKLSLFKTSGEKILERKYFNSQWIDIGEYPKGVYFIRIQFENSNLNYKVVFR